MATKKKIKVQGKSPVGINVSQGATKETVKETLDAILAVIRDSMDSSVLIKALDVLNNATSTKPISISNCHIEMKA